ncbi:MAG: alpha/beta fold hydrolase [Trueperaceae bacterium]
MAVLHASSPRPNHGPLADAAIRLQRALLPTGITLEYAFEGPADAPVLAFVHGLGSSLHQFVAQAESFGDRYRVLLLSLRGHGGSGNPTTPTADAYTPAALAQDVAALLDHLRVEALHYVGNSLGGLVGYELLRVDPARVRSLTTFGTTAELASSRWTYWLAVGTVRLLGVNGVARLVGASAAKDEAVGAEIKRLYRQASKVALLQIPQHIARYDYTETLRSTRRPMLLIQGARDKGINDALASTLAALDAAHDARVVPLADAGHFANMERAERFDEILGGFLDGVDARSVARPIGSAPVTRSS